MAVDLCRTKKKKRTKRRNDKNGCKSFNAIKVARSWWRHTPSQSTAIDSNHNFLPSCILLQLVTLCDSIRCDWLAMLWVWCDWATPWSPYEIFEKVKITHSKDDGLERNKTYGDHINNEFRDSLVSLSMCFRRRTSIGASKNINRNSIRNLLWSVLWQLTSISERAWRPVNRKTNEFERKMENNQAERSQFTRLGMK